MRAVCRDLGGPWPGYDVVFLAKRATTEQEYSKVVRACRKLVTRFLEESR
jgi:ribonuclease P protein component